MESHVGLPEIINVTCLINQHPTYSPPFKLIYTRMHTIYNLDTSDN